MKTLLFFSIILFFVFTINAAKIDTVLISGLKSEIQARAVVVTPEVKNQENMSRFPVLYLLHGWSGSYHDWIKHTDLGLLADKYQCIIVCPDGGYAGWYLDSPLKTESQYETYIANDVVNFIDTNYNSIANVNSRSICGLSMGGHGALRLLIRHPDLFGSAGSMSGVLELNESIYNLDLASLIGDLKSNPEAWKNYSVYYQLDSLAGLNKGILLDCGIEDMFIVSNRKTHEKLMELKIAHDYFERSGGHNWVYWVNALEYHILFFSRLWSHN